MRNKSKSIAPQFLAALVSIAATLIGACCANAQVNLNSLPPNTAVGRLGSGITGGAQAIPFATLLSQLNGLNTNVINVVSNGADNTGNTDSAPVFNNAAAALADTCGTVFAPAGTYLWNEEVTIPTCVNLVGAGAQDWAQINSEVTEFKWGGATHGIMLALGQGWTGRLENFSLEAEFTASIGIDMGAPLGCYVSNVIVNDTVTGGTGGDSQDAAVIAYLLNQKFPGNVQAPSALAGCTFVNFSINPSTNSAFWGRGVTDFVWINPFVEATGSGNTAIHLEGDKGVIADNDSDTVHFYGGLISSFSGATGFLSGDDANSDGQGGYGYSFYGTAFNNDNSSNYNFDIRNSPTADGEMNYCFGCFVGPFSPYFIGSNGTNPGFIKILAEFGISTPGTGTLGGSPVTYTNLLPYSVEFFITANDGNISGLVLIRQSGNTTLAASSNGIVLDPGDALKFTYSSTAPTYAVIPH